MTRNLQTIIVLNLLCALNFFFKVVSPQICLTYGISSAFSLFTAQLLRSFVMKYHYSTVASD